MTRTSVPASANTALVGRAMHRLITTLVLALCLLGCTGEVTLLTGGIEVCSARDLPLYIEGVLVADPRSATAIAVDPDTYEWPAIAGTTMSLMWPPGYSARRRSSGVEVEVLNAAGERVATTGTRVRLGLQAIARATRWPNVGYTPLPATIATCGVR